MRNLKILILATLLALLFSITAVAQTVTVTPPGSLLVCNENTFQLTVNNAGGNNTLSIAASVNTPACPGTVTCLNEQLTYFTVVSPAGVTATFNGGNQQWDIYPVSSGVTVQLTVRLDCGLVRPCITPGSTNIELTQTYYLNGNVINTTNNGTNSLSQNISYPYLIDETALSFNSSYLNTITVLHKYRNTGLSDAVIQFKFMPFAEGLCTADSLLGIEYASGDANSPATLNYALLNAGWNSITIERDSALFIRKQIKITGCTDAANGCNQIKDSLIWRCQQNPVCDTCLQVMDKSYALNNSGTKNISITRITPVNHLLDSSCMGSSLLWEYRIRNTGNVNLASAVIEFFCNESDFAGQLQLVDSGSVQLIAHNNTAWSMDTTLRFYNVLCQAAVLVPLKRINIRLTDFMAGDSVTFKFTTYRCCDEADTLFNTMKKFGNWRFRITGTDICNSSITINHSVNNDPVWMTTMDYYETVSNLTNPPFTVFGPSTPVLYADIKTPALAFAPVYQLAGCQGPCLLKGFLRVTIASDTGLVVDTPLVHILNAPFQTPDTLWPVYWYKTIPDSVCEAGEWHFYFDMTNASANITSLLQNGRIGFRLRSCCMAKAITDYSISLAMLPAPRSNCFMLGLTDTTHTVPPACLQGNCCFLPLARAGGKISVKCPGCLAPGLELTSYSINRISLGRKDTQNNFLADLPVEPIDSAYLAVYEPFMHTRSASFSDLLIDRMTGHFQDGDSSGGGYSYQQMLNAGGVLNVLQLQRLFSPDVNYPVNLQIQRFRLYIDKPDTVNQCIDCAAFTSDTNGYRTIHILEVTGNDLVNYLSYNGNNHFYTFDARAGQNLFNHVVYSHPLFPFTAFAPGQRYRLSALYSVCSRYGPNDYNTQSLPDQKRTVEIVNFMFLSGEVHAENEIMTTLGDMPNTAAGAASLGFTSYNQHFADTFAFVCARTNGRVYLLGDEIQNWSFYRFEQNDSCQKFVLLDLVSRTAGQKAETVYPYEYKGPSLTPWRTAVFIPQGYTAAAQAQVRSSFFLQTGAWFGNWLSFPVTQVNDSVIIHSDSIFNVHPLSCLTDTASIYNRLYLSDNMLALTIRIPLIQAQCLSDSVFHPALNSITILFTRDTLACFTPSSAGCQADSIRLKPGVTDSLFTVKPELSVYLNPPQSASGQPQVCWTVKARNLNHRPGSFFYLSVPPVPWFSNWSLTYNGNLLTPVNGVFQIDPVLSQSLDVTMMLCAQYDSCTGSDSLPLHFGWNCNGFPQSYFDYSACFIDSVYFHWIDQPTGSQTAYDYPSAVNLCDPVTITGFLYSTGTQILIPLSLQLNNTTGYSVQHVQLTSCFNPDTVSLPVTQPYHWTIDTLSLFDDSLFYKGNCLKALVTLQKNCDMSLQPGDTLLLPIIQFGFTTFCNDEDTLYAQARTQPASPLDYKAVYSGISNCTNCFSITKFASTDTIATGDTITYSIILCANNDAAYSVTLHELLPANFVMTTGQQQQTVSLPQQGCDTVIVSGYFTYPGNCMDNINTVLLITSQNDTLSADTCVTVMFPCWYPGINIVADSTFASSLGVSGYTNAVIYIENRFYVDIDFTFTNCTVYVAAGGQIIVMNEFTLTLDSTAVMGCERMWERILLQPNGATIYVINNSKIMDAHWGIYANDGTRFTVHNSDISECVYGIFVPPNQFHTVNYITATVEGSRFGLINGPMKGQYAGQPNDYSPNGPKAGMELHDVRVMGIGNNASIAPNYFSRLHTGIASYNSVIRFIRNSEFVLIQNNPDYSQQVIGGSAVVSIGQPGFPPAEINLFPVTGGGATIASCRRGVYTSYSTTRVSDVNMTGVETGVYSEQTKPFGETKVSNCNISASLCGIDFFNNHGCLLMLAENNQINIGQFGTGIRMREFFTPNNAGYRIIYNRDIVMNSASTGISAINVDRAVINDNNIIQKQTAPLGFETDMTGILIDGCRRTGMSCNTVTRHSSIADFYTYGYRVNESPQNMMDCNLADKNDEGVVFGGSNCTGTLFRRNTMRDNFIGLHLNGSAKIGQQPVNQTPPFHGNRWEGTFSSNIGAVNWNANPIGNLQFNLFTILDPNQPGGDAAHNPNIPTGQTGWPDNTNWFDPKPTGNTLGNCSAHTLCGGALPDFTGGEEDENTRRLIALDSALTADFPDETRLMDKQHLYGSLTEDTMLLASDTLYRQFKAGYDSASIGYLYQARQAFALAGIVDSLLLIDILEMQQAIRLFNDSIAFINSLILSAPDSSLLLLRAALMDSVSILEQSVSMILEQLKATDTLAVMEADARNASVQPAGLPDGNEKTMNELQAAWMLGGKDAVANRYYDALAVAVQCPYQGGPAVYQARVFVSMFNDSIQYDDKTTCRQAGYYRQQIQQIKKQHSANAVEIIPNPANETVTVKLQTKEEGLCSVRLLNPAGETILQGSFACSEKQYKMNTGRVAPGIYYVEVKAGNTIFMYSKLAIVR